MIKSLFTWQLKDSYLRENFVRIKEYLDEVRERFDSLKVPIYTTNERDQLTAKKAMVIFNETTSKFQGYDGSSWQNFH